jgi:hypothetical protein
MLQIDIFDKLFRVQATIEHLLAVGRAEEMELRFLDRALKTQQEAIKEIALGIGATMKGTNP